MEYNREREREKKECKRCITRSYYVTYNNSSRLVYNNSMHLDGLFILNALFLSPIVFCACAIS